MMEDTQRKRTLDDLAPKTQFRFPNGAVLVVGTRRDDDDPLGYGVHLGYSSGRNVEPEMNILLPPYSIDILIPILQEAANEARFIMGEKMVDYPSHTGNHETEAEEGGQQSLGG
ncbi:MAG: hypothetical protein ACUVWX_05340 [Kiritimatiellia bacterium]